MNTKIAETFNSIIYELENLSQGHFLLTELFTIKRMSKQEYYNEYDVYILEKIMQVIMINEVANDEVYINATIKLICYLIYLIEKGLKNTEFYEIDKYGEGC